MAGNVPSAVIRDVQTLFSVGAVGGLTDKDLLDLFVARRGTEAELAFAALIQRHGRMVWGVCRRTLADHHAAADAFQATFLILVRKAGSIRVDGSLGRWLHGVSRRVAMRAKVTNARRSARETWKVDEVTDSAVASESSELLKELDREIHRLPERYRDVVLLCDLGGMTHEEAARQIGCAVGTVGSRLSRGRERLKARLIRRGLAPSAALLAAGLSLNSVSGAVPAALEISTVQAAMRLANGETAVIATSVALLTKEVTKAIFWGRLKVATAAILIATSGLTILTVGTASATKAPLTTSQEEKPIGENGVTSKEIIADTIKTYAAARSYEDQGEVSVVFSEPTGRRTVKKPFSTKFVRPKLYRFEFTERRGDAENEQNRFVIWSDAAPEQSKTWWTIRPKIKEDPLAIAIGAAAGISSISSTTIPHLLMPKVISSSPLTGFKDTRLIGEESLDGIPCHKIEGANVVGNPQIVWIEKPTSLVKKIFVTSKILNATIETTTTYRPRINVSIAPEEFEFEPPKP